MIKYAGQIFVWTIFLKQWRKFGAPFHLMVKRGFMRDTPGGALRASGTRLATTEAERRPAMLA